MKTIGRFFLLAAAVAMLYSCSLADLGNGLAGTGFNIFGTPEIDTKTLVESLGNTAVSENFNDDGSFSITIGDSPINIEKSYFEKNKFNPDKHVYAANSSVNETLSEILLGNSKDQLASSLSGTLTEEEADVLKNTSALYSGIIDYAVEQIESNSSGIPDDVMTAISDIQSQFSEVQTAENLTQADAIFMQSFATLTYSVLDIISQLDVDPDPDPEPEPEPPTDITQLDGFMDTVRDAELLCQYSDIVKDTAGSSLPATVADLYDSIFSSLLGGM